MGLTSREEAERKTEIICERGKKKYLDVGRGDLAALHAHYTHHTYTLRAHTHTHTHTHAVQPQASH